MIGRELILQSLLERPGAVPFAAQVGRLAVHHVVDRASAGRHARTDFPKARDGRLQVQRRAMDRVQAALVLPLPGPPRTGR